MTPLCLKCREGAFPARYIPGLIAADEFGAAERMDAFLTGIDFRTTLCNVGNRSYISPDGGGMEWRLTSVPTAARWLEITWRDSGTKFVPLVHDCTRS